ncbi:MAG: hypothetical protein ACKVT2_19795 [Saprospiraceae bacterium]
MKAFGIDWDKNPMPPAVWEKVLHKLGCDDVPAGGGGENFKDQKHLD